LLGDGGHDRQPLVVAGDQPTTRPRAILQAGQALGLEAMPPVPTVCWFMPMRVAI
jgi:hypothetical protein